MKKQRRRLILGITLIIALGTFSILIIPHFFQKHEIVSVLETIQLTEDEQVEFADLDGDSIVELFRGRRFEEDEIINNSIQFRDLSGKKPQSLLEQINFTELLVGENKFFVTEADNKKGAELYVAVPKQNNLYLHIYTHNFETGRYPQTPDTTILIDSFFRYRGAPALNMRHELTTDYDSNGSNELYFSVMGSYSIYPRKHYKLDLGTHKLTSTESVCFLSRISDTANFKGKKVFLTTVGSTGNDKPWFNIPYSDYYSWLYIFDQDLRLVNEPKRFGYFPSSIKCYSYTDTTILALYNDSTGYILATLKFDGTTIDSIKISGKADLFKWNGSFFITDKKTNIYEVDDKLRLNHSNSFDKVNEVQYIVDLDKNGYEEILYFNRQFDALLIVDGKTHRVTELPFNIVNNMSYPIKFLEHDDELAISIIDNKHQLKFFKYQKVENRGQIIKIILLVLLFLVTLVVLTLTLQHRYLQVQLKRKNEIHRLQFNGILSELEPYSVLNNLKFIFEGKLYKNEALLEEYLNKFTKIFAQSISNSSEIHSILNDEIILIENYCRVEEIRRRNSISLSIKSNNLVNRHQIILPRNLLYTFVKASLASNDKLSSGDIRIKISIEANKNQKIIQVQLCNSVEKSFNDNIITDLSTISRLYSQITESTVTVEAHDHDASCETTPRGIRVILE